MRGREGNGMIVPTRTIVVTLKEFALESTATATGPTYASASLRSVSLPAVMETIPLMSAPTVLLLNLHCDCCV